MTAKSANSYINQYLEKNSRMSATELCNHLIADHGFSRDTYSTGRPKLYTDVVKYLEKLHRTGHLEAIERNQEDCKYEVLSVDISEEWNKEYVVTEKEHNTGDKRDELQMSLF
ncbi:DUF3895 domain-containing protein [Metabacillus halosaccharovorans]|uniref:DUF3895 domain-containing protein n=1 Tax=Metabacillus halosaccharovorans TaxID=930124 RepID=UPI00203CA85D|nr:DUF3895 domain-containing protein [Metabacillus halosaccharovorans]MCM3443672.1 DUF3895 domain-containing protein [Metabacillus halosaccharovorans]